MYRGTFGERLVQYADTGHKAAICPLSTPACAAPSRRSRCCGPACRASCRSSSRSSQAVVAHSHCSDCNCVVYIDTLFNVVVHRQKNPLLLYVSSSVPVERGSTKSPRCIAASAERHRSCAAICCRNHASSASAACAALLADGSELGVLYHPDQANLWLSLSPQPRPDQTGSTKCLDQGEVANSVKLLDVGVTAAAGRHHTNRPPHSAGHSPLDSDSTNVRRRLPPAPVDSSPGRMSLCTVR